VPRLPAPLAALEREIVGCERCPRLRAWCRRVAREKTLRFRDQEYWGRPVPGFGDPAARVLIVGLAPAAHGGNRTGRVFTGDRSGDFLFAALHRAGFANQPRSIDRRDGLRLTGAWVAAMARCAPPANRPNPDELANCRPYLARELQLLARVRVIVALGGIAWKGVAALARAGLPRGARLPSFAHGVEAVAGDHALLGSYHPSQQNTFTGRLTPPMLDAIFERARELAGR
jgi:uracil-DNA glycosylase family 4